MRNGAIAELIGDVRWTNMKVSDCLEAGLEVSMIDDDVKDGYAMIDTAVIVGRSDITDDEQDAVSPHGIITPRTEYYWVKNVKFYNYNFNEAGALGTCSHCEHDGNTDSGARTHFFENLYFDEDTVDWRIKWEDPYYNIFFDTDGTLTERGANSYAYAEFPHLDLGSCEVDDTYGLDGVTCDDSQPLRRVSFYGATDYNNVVGMPMKILKFDDEFLGSDDDELEEYLEDEENYTDWDFKPKERPVNSWTTAYLTGHKYKIHIGDSGIDVDSIKVQVSERWESTDEPIYFV